MVTQLEEQHGQRVPLRFVECGKELASGSTLIATSRANRVSRAR
jgi:hypothetical protein